MLDTAPRRRRTPVRLVNSRGQPLEVIGGDAAYIHSPRPASPSSFMHRRNLSYVDPLFHHPGFDDYSSSSSSDGDSLEESSFPGDNDDSNHDDAASVITVPSQEPVALTIRTREESECQLGGVLGMLARAFSKTTTTQPYEYSGDPTNVLEKTMTCPISKEIMMDPVMDPDGHSYERAAILQWLYQDSRSPITRKPLSRRDLVPNRALRAVIHQYIQMGGATGLELQQQREKEEDVGDTNKLMRCTCSGTGK